MSASRSVRMSQRGVAPPLDGTTGWLDSAPLSPAELRGHVVLYAFWTYTCINWLRALPYVRAWDRKYRDHGLTVVGVHTPEFAFERETDNVRTAARSHHIEFPVVLDSDYEIWRAFDNHYWPALYLADQHGVIRYSQFGEGRYAETERAIRQLLVESGAADIADDAADAEGIGDEAPADWADLESAETYLGYDRAAGFASPGGVRPDRPTRYDVPSPHARGTWALSGEWTIHPDRVTAEDRDAGIAVRFHARDLHLVMAPTGRSTPVRFHVRLDGRPPGAAHGLDIDDEGAGTIVEPRMYQLIRQHRPIVDRTAEITFPDGAAAAFVTTFG